MQLLAQCMEIGFGFSELKRACNVLTGYAVETRYPDDYVEYERDDAVEAMELAGYIKDFVIERIPAHEKKAEAKPRLRLPTYLSVTNRSSPSIQEPLIRT